MKYINYIAIIVLIALFSCGDNKLNPEEKIDIPEGYSLIWQDEFNESSIDLEKWTYETGDGTSYGLPAGWGNSELQIYTSDPENAHIEKTGVVSSLKITAIDNGTEGYTSAKLVTKDLMNIRFGRVDVRAKMPQGQGIWPAIWMLGTNRDIIDWPGCGEIDIAEVLGHQPAKYYATLHFTNGENKLEYIQNMSELSGESFSDDYHVFSVDWTPESVTFILDGSQVANIPIEADMKEFLRSFYLILNVAVGGSWPGNPDTSTLFPQSMYVDYVRVFTKDDFTPPTEPELNIEEESIGQPIEPNIGDNAIKGDFNDLGNLEVISYGAGGEPTVSTSATAIDGDLSLSFDYPGGNWGGAYIELTEFKDLSSYSNLKFSLHAPQNFSDAEIKLENPTNSKAIFLKNYTGVDVANGFKEYTIPLSDFTDLSFTEVKIPFSIWNPLDTDQNYLVGTILIDNLYFTN